jgi:hypothetical protein
MCLLVPLPPYVQYAASPDMAHQALAMTVQKPLLVAELRWVGGWVGGAWRFLVSMAAAFGRVWPAASGGSFNVA